MNSRIFEILNNNMQVRLYFGVKPLRVYPWGRVPEDTRKPYAVYAVYNAVPENYLAGRPDRDNKGTQVNVYAETAKSLENCFAAIRDALELDAHMTNYSTPDLDADTNLYSCRMEFDFWDAR